MLTYQAARFAPIAESAIDLKSKKLLKTSFQKCRPNLMLSLLDNARDEYKFEFFNYSNFG